MNTKNNQRTRLSKLMMKNALMDLLKEKGDIHKISVRELCERAQLNRSTFYAHYSEPQDLLFELEEEILASTDEHLKKIGAENDTGAHKFILSFLKYMRENDKVFRTLLVDAADPVFKSRFMQQTIIRFIENLQITFVSSVEQYVFSYILSGSTGIIIQWLRSGCSTDESTICSLLFAINKSALENLGEYTIQRDE